MPKVKLYRVRPQPLKSAPEDRTLVMISVEQAQKYGIELDETQFPTLRSLEAWHKENNPQLFVEDE